jgi:NTE family protein
VSAWLPRGFISTQPLKDTVRRALGSEDGWAPHPGYSAVACDYETGKPVAFGTPEAPHADLADAVAASCAIPGFYHPVEIDGRRYVDGGMRSTSNLDALAGEGLDVVICLNPMSSLHAAEPRTIGERLTFGMRAGAGRQLGAEARRLRTSGTDVVILQPTVHDLDVMGTNLMSGGRRHEVIERATDSVTEHLRECGLGERLAATLPAGAPALVRRPKGSPDRWPDTRLLARERFATPEPPKVKVKAKARPRPRTRPLAA